MNPFPLAAMGFAVLLAVIALLLKIHYDREDKKRLREEEEKVEQAQKGAEYIPTPTPMSLQVGPTGTATPWPDSVQGKPAPKDMEPFDFDGVDP